MTAAGLAARPRPQLSRPPSGQDHYPLGIRVQRPPHPSPSPPTCGRTKITGVDPSGAQVSTAHSQSVIHPLAPPIAFEPLPRANPWRPLAGRGGSLEGGALGNLCLPVLTPLPGGEGGLLMVTEAAPQISKWGNRPRSNNGPLTIRIGARSSGCGQPGCPPPFLTSLT